MSKIVSIELDAHTRRALIKLQQMGLSQSDAIRLAIQDAALRLREPKRLAAEMAKLEADPVDQAEMLAVINFKER
jgi:antitoxin component of RelBE/YafQ-DinJ toxin-antitoxin module